MSLFAALIYFSGKTVSVQIPEFVLTSERLFEATNKKVSSNSVVFSDDFSQFSYVTPAMEMILNGKSLGKYKQVTPMTFDQKGNYAFLSNTEKEPVNRINMNGQFLKTDFTPVQIARAGSRGPLIWFEKNESGMRMMKGEKSTGFYPSITKLRFSADGSAYTFVYPKKIKQLTPEEIKQLTDSGQKVPEARESDDYLVDSKEQSSLMGRRLGVWPFEGGKSVLEISLDLDPGTVNVGGQKFLFRANRIDNPIFDSTESHFAFRYSYTKPSKTTFIDAYNYLIDGIPQPTPSVQTAFSFSQDGTNWILCGREGTQWYVLESGKQPALIDRSLDFPGCPNEGFRTALDTKNGWALLFQGRQSLPKLVVSNTQYIDLPFESVDLNSLSLNPSRNFLALVGTTKGKRTQYVIPIGKRRTEVIPLKSDEEAGLVKMEKGFWRDDQTFVFITLKGSMIQRNTFKVTPSKKD
jgi:hypothetical protein